MKHHVLHSEYARVGDRVMGYLKSLDEGDNADKANVNGVIIGFTERTHIQSRTSVWHETKLSPGIYVVKDKPIIKTTEGVVGSIDPRDLLFIDPSLTMAAISARWNDVAYCTDFSKPVFKSALPPSEFYEGDKVQTNNVIGCFRGTIKRMIYNDALETTYGVKYDDFVTSTIDLYAADPAKRATKFTLLSRGNYWKWENDRDSVLFNSIIEETNFKLTIPDIIDAVEDPDSGDIYWHDREQLFEAFKREDGDLIINPDGPCAKLMPGQRLLKINNDVYFKQRMRNYMRFVFNLV